MMGSLELRFRVKSLHPKMAPQALVKELVAQRSELERHLRGLRPEYANLVLDESLETAVPLEPATAHLLVTLAGLAGGAVASGFLARLGEDIYDFLKSRIRDGRVDPPER